MGHFLINYSLAYESYLHDICFTYCHFVAKIEEGSIILITQLLNLMVLSRITFCSCINYYIDEQS